MKSVGKFTGEYEIVGHQEPTKKEKELLKKVNKNNPQIKVNATTKVSDTHG